MDYSAVETQERIEKLLSELESSRWVKGKHGVNLGSLYTESWLRSFLGYVERSQGLFDYNITTEREFIDTLFDAYLDPSSPFYDDVKFNADRTRINASRFIVQTINITDSNDEKDMAMELRAIAAAQEGLNVVSTAAPVVFFENLNQSATFLGIEPCRPFLLFELSIFDFLFRRPSTTRSSSSLISSSSFAKRPFNAS